MGGVFNSQLVALVWCSASGKWTDEDRANKASNEGVASPVPSGSRSSGATGGAGGGAGAGAAAEEEEEEEGVAFEALRPTYTHEALVKLMDMGLLRVCTWCRFTTLIQ